MELLYLLSGAIFLAALLGGAIPLIRNWREGHIHHFVSFGAGVLMGASFLHMVPESVELIGRNTGIAILMGFLLFYILEKFMMIHPCQEDDCEFHHIGVPAFIGFSFHNVIDGVALGASFLVPHLMPYVFLALISHHIPTSVAFTSILKVSRYSTKKIVSLLVIFAAMVPLGALLSHSMLIKWSTVATGWAIGISAGTFIHIAICDLLPQVHKSGNSNFSSLVSFLFGLGAMIAASFLVAH